MKIKQTLVNIILSIAILGCFGYIIYNYQVAAKEQTAMQVFPSYDWGEEDNVTMAYLCANTNGNDREKQQSIIDCLDYMWKYNRSANDYIKYLELKFYKEPTAHDYELIRLVVQQKWADEK